MQGHDLVENSVGFPGGLGTETETLEKGQRCLQGAGQGAKAQVADR